MYNDVLKGKKNWQWVALAMIFANMLLILGMTRVSLQSKAPLSYITKVDSQGNAQFGGFLSDANQQVSSVMVNAFIRRYIENVRSVIADPVAEKRSLDYVYAVTRGESLNFINSYYHNNDPFKHAKNSTVEVQIQAALPKSSQTWQIDWIETERNLEGGIINQSHYEALVTVEQKTVNDPNEINVNPLGLFVTRLSWSQQM
jgi:type IV secretion system protein VirB5